MKQKFIFVTISIFALLTACSKGGSEKMVSLGGASIENPSVVARVREGSMYVRGIDQQRLKPDDIQNPFTDFVYAVAPGKHALLVMNIQSGHIIPTENMRCYIIEAQFQADVPYRIDEDKTNWIAIIKREDNGKEVASAKLSDQSSAFGNLCQWK
ncbi:MAG: hypothetical protein C4516_08625 [Oxalobacter sp.]|nr:MAG: hypothetical protein C4516_08625 [Oxalobacter sp.]